MFVNSDELSSSHSRRSKIDKKMIFGLILFLSRDYALIEYVCAFSGALPNIITTGEVAAGHNKSLTLSVRDECEFIMAIAGKISEWNDAKGYGFITVDNYRGKIFFHISDLQGHAQRPKVNEAVHFKLTKEPDGSLHAVDIHRPLVYGLSLALSVWFITVLFASIYLVKYPPIVVLFYILISAITYAVYAFDRSAMYHNDWRVSEWLLHTLSVLGGWPGALMAQALLKFKTLEQPFRMIFWLTVLINFSIFVYTLTAPGAMLMSTIISSLKLF